MKKRMLAVLMAATMCFSLTACGGGTSDATGSSSDATQEASGYTGADTLVVGEDTIEGKFNPLFYSAQTDDDVNVLIFDTLLSADREGAIVLTGIEGETREYNGTDYTYYSIADCEIVENEDGTVDYIFTMREDIQYSDGSYATIDDAIFALYAALDPSYDGITSFSALPIEGLSAYVTGMSTLYELLMAAGEDNTDYTYWDAETQEAFWSTGLDEAGAAFAQSIVDYVVSNYATTTYEDYVTYYVGASLDELLESEGLQVAFGMAMWGFAGGLDGEGLFVDLLGNTYDIANGVYPTTEDYWANLTAAYENDYDLLSDTEAASGSLWSYMDAAYAIGVVTGESAENISGIVKNSDYSMTITLTEMDATAIYTLAGIPLMSVAYYGDGAVDVENNYFGFTKGDLSGIKSLISTPMGSGAYTLLDFTNGTVHLQANEYYWQGCPKITYINFVGMADADKIPGLETGTIDVTQPSYNADAVAEITRINDGEGVTGSVITTTTVENLGYGYIGINANTVSVGGDASSDASKNLRKAIATIFAVYRDEAINSYYGELASIINYPISNTSWAAPKSTDEGYAVAFSVDVNGDPIYTDGMTDDEKYEAAIEAALGFFEAAGYTVEDGVLTAAPEGAKLEYTAMIPGGGTGDHPNYMILTSARDALATIGFTLTIKDLSDGTVTIGNALKAGTAEIWTMAWSATVDPDMYQIYYADVANGGDNAGGSNMYYAIADEELDNLIMLARQSSDITYRKTLYKEALDIIIDWACEIPVYQRLNAFAFSTERINMDTVTPDITTYWGWYQDIQNMEMN